MPDDRFSRGTKEDTTKSRPSMRGNHNQVNVTFLCHADNLGSRLAMNHELLDVDTVSGNETLVPAFVLRAETDPTPVVGVTAVVHGNELNGIPVIHRLMEKLSEHRLLKGTVLAVPIVIQVYLNSALAYVFNRRLGVAHAVAGPSALIGASNFFELAVAAAITLFGFDSGAALATVVGVLVEVPLMLSVVRIVNATRHWYEERAA